MTETFRELLVLSLRRIPDPIAGAEPTCSVNSCDGTVERIECQTKVWSAGVAASPLAKIIADQSGAEIDRAGRIKVQPDLSLTAHREIAVIGDLASAVSTPADPSQGKPTPVPGVGLASARKRGGAKAGRAQRLECLDS